MKTANESNLRWCVSPWQIQTKVLYLGALMLSLLLIGTPASADDDTNHARALSKAFRRSAERTLPSVVTILCRHKQESGQNSSILDIIGGPDAQVYDSIGSGVIISDDGWILTNHHVIEDADKIEVRLHDGRRYFSDKTLADPSSDVALVKIESKASSRRLRSATRRSWP